MSNKLVYVLIYLKILRQCPKSIHRRTHQNKIKKPCWRELLISKPLLSKASETIMMLRLPLFTKRVFLVQNTKNEQHSSILHIRINLSIKFQLKLTILTFETKFAQEGCFQSKTEKVNSWLLHIQISLSAKF